MEEFIAFSGKVLVDGVMSGGHMATKQRERRVQGHRISRDEVRVFKFSDIQCIGMSHLINSA